MRPYPPNHAAMGPGQGAPILPRDQDALDALETAPIIRILVERLVVPVDRLDRPLQLVVENVGSCHQVACLVGSSGQTHQPIEHLDHA